MSTQPHTPTHRLTQYFEEIEAEELQRSDALCDSYLRDEVTTRDPEPEMPKCPVLAIVGVVVVGVVLCAGLALLFGGDERAAPPPAGRRSVTFRR